MGLIDEELSAAMALYGQADQAWRQAWRPGTGPSVAVRFLTACDSPQRVELLVRVEGLIEEADRVPDPGGPIGVYLEAVHQWVTSHPEIDPVSFDWLVHRLAFAHR